MAKQPSRAPATNARVKVRVFEFEMDGTDDSIQDTMKTLAAAFTRGGGSVPPTRRLRADTSLAATPETADEGEAEDPDTVEDEFVDDVIVKQPAAPKKPRKVQNYEVLDDIRFDVVKPTLTEFVATFNPKSDLKRYLTIALWYKDHLKVPEINVRHWYTAFKYLKWTLPNNPAQPIRDLRNAKKLSKGKEIGHSLINHIGEKDLESLNKAS